MKATILCITTGNPLTMAGVENRESWYYEMAPPGQILHWGPRSCVPDKITEPDPIPVYKSGEGKEYPYGLAIMEDLIILKDDLTQNKQTLFETVLNGRERAQDIVRVWMKYGGVLIAGNEPTQAEIDKAIAQRTDFARHRIDEAISGKMKGMAGHGHVDYNACDRAWAMEMGARLPDTYEQLERIAANVEAPKNGVSTSSTETAPCPACFQMVDPRATKCRHCNEKFNQPVGVMLQSPAASAAEAAQ